MPPQPCHGCRFAIGCETAGLVNCLAVEFWLKDEVFGCADYTPEFHHGIEGVFK